MSSIILKPPSSSIIDGNVNNFFMRIIVAVVSSVISVTVTCVMQPVLAQPVLLPSLKPPTNSPNGTSISSPTVDAVLIHECSSVAELDANYEEHQSSLASQNGEEIADSDSLRRGLSLSNRVSQPAKSSSVSARNSRVCRPLPSRSHKQKSRVLHAPADDNDLPTCCRQPKFTLHDFSVEFAASKDISVNVMEKSLYSIFTDCGLHKVVKKQREPVNSELSMQLLQLPQDWPQVCTRVPAKQLLIEMAAVIRERLSEV